MVKLSMYRINTIQTFLMLTKSNIPKREIDSIKLCNLYFYVRTIFQLFSQWQNGPKETNNSANVKK